MKIEASALVTQLEDGYSAYLGNQGDMMGVGNNKIYNGSPLRFETDFHILCGNEEQELTDLRVVSVSPATKLLQTEVDKYTGKVTIIANNNLDFTHEGNEYKVRIKGTCYGLTRGHADNPTYLESEFILQGVPEAKDGVVFRLQLSRTFIPKDGHGDIKNPPLSADVNVVGSYSVDDIITTEIMDAGQMSKIGLYLSYDVDGVEQGGKVQAPFTIFNIGTSIKPMDAITAHLWFGEKRIDRQDIFVVQDGADNVRVDLDNEMDSMLYNGKGERVSKDVISNIRVFDGAKEVTSQIKASDFSIEPSGCTAKLEGTKITVTAMSENSGSVRVRATYLGKTYTTVLTLIRKNETDKFDFSIVPNDISYNTTSGIASTDKIVVEVYRTFINTQGNGQTELCQTLPQGFKLMENGTQVSYANGKYTRKDIDFANTADFRYELLNKDMGVEDYETIPINKTTNLTIKLHDVKYASGTEVQPTNDKFTDSIPVVEQGMYLWCWTHIVYSDDTSVDTYVKSYQGIDNYTVDIDNEMSAIQRTDAGKPMHSRTITTNILYYKGVNPVTYKITNITCPAGITCDNVTPSQSKTYTGKTQLSFNVSTNANILTPQDISITCADVNGEHSHTAVLTIIGVLGTVTYELKTSTDEVVYNPNTKAFTPTSVNIEAVVKNESGMDEVREINVPSGHRLWYGTNDTTPTRSVAAGSRTNGASVTLSSNISSIDFYLCNSTSATFSTANVVDKERVWIIAGGVDGKSYEGTSEYYYATQSETSTLPSHTATSHSSWKSNIKDLTNKFSATYPYLWNFEIVEMTMHDGTKSYTATDPEMISVWGQDGQNGKSVSGIDERYRANSGTKPSGDPTSSDSTDSKNAGFSEDHPYLWNNQRVIFDDDTYGSWSGWQLLSHWGQSVSYTDTYGVSTSESSQPSSWGTLANAKSNWNTNNRFLWKKEVIVTADGTTTNIFVLAVWAAAGIQGCVLRPCKYVSDTTYYNDSLRDSPREGETSRYIDVVQVKDGSNNMHAYVVEQSEYSTSTQPYISTSNYNPNTKWNAESFKPLLATDILLATNAHIDIGQGNAVLLECDGSTTHITAGASGGTHNNDGTHSGYAFWAGTSSTGVPTNTQIGNAAFNVTHEGKLKASDAEIKGKITATSGKIDGQLEIGANGYIGVGASKNSDGIYTGSGGASLFKDFIVFNETNRQALIGTTNMLGTNYLGRFVDTVVDPYLSKYGIVMDVSGSSLQNYAIYANNGSIVCKSGMNIGLGYHKISITQKDTIYAITLRQSTTIFVSSSVSLSDIGVALPTLGNVRSAFGLKDTDYFTIKLTVIGHIQCWSEFKVYGRNSTVYKMSGTTKDYWMSKTDKSKPNELYPQLLNNDGNTDWGWDMSRGDVIEFHLTYDEYGYYAYQGLERR